MNDLNKALEQFGETMTKVSDELRELYPKIEKAMVEFIDKFDEWYDNNMDKAETRSKEWLNARYVGKSSSPTEKGR